MAFIDDYIEKGNDTVHMPKNLKPPRPPKPIKPKILKIFTHGYIEKLNTHTAYIPFKEITNIHNNAPPDLFEAWMNFWEKYGEIEEPL